MPRRKRVDSPFIGREKVFYTRCIVHACPRRQRAHVTLTRTNTRDTAARDTDYRFIGVEIRYPLRRREFLAVTRRNIWRSSHAGFIRVVSDVEIC